MTSCSHINSDLATASNMRIGGNPPYSFTDFNKIYPQFLGTIAEPKVPKEVLEMYVELAHASLQKKRWHEAWEVAMGWFVAHFATLYLQGTTDPDSPAAAVINAGMTKGLQASKSVGSVSVSYDFSLIANELDGWAAWKLTIFGTQLATYAKMLSKGGIYAV